MHPATLYLVGLCAPRGPQLPVYSDQMDVVVDMIDLQDLDDVPLVETFSVSDRPEQRIDIVRAVWNDDMEATRKRLASLRARAVRATARRARTAPAALDAPEPDVPETEVTAPSVAVHS